jgi:hypothetical protein
VIKRLSVSSKPFQPGLIFKSKAGAYPSSRVGSLPNLQILTWRKRLVGINAVVGSPKANGRESKTFLGLVFNYKLGCYNDVHVFVYVDTHPHL